MREIEKLEYDIWCLRGRLNDLARSGGQQYGQQYYDERLAQIERELEFMMGQAAYLRGRSPGAYNRESGPVSAPQSFGPEGRRIPDQPQAPPPAYPVKKDRGNLEKAVGARIMGVLASVLIFISLAIFGSMLIPNLGVAGQIFIMYAVSFCIMACGIALLKKNRESRFHLSLSACGTMAVCISIFITRLFFGVIDSLVCVVLMLLWMVAVLYLARTLSHMFRVVGEVGFLFLTILGVSEGQNAFLFIGLALVYAVSALLFHVTDEKSSYESRWAIHIIHTLAILVYIAGASFGELSYFSGVLLAMAAEGYMIYCEEVKHGVLFNIMSSLLVTALAIGLSVCLDCDSPGLFLMAGALFLGAVFCFKKGAVTLPGDILTGVLYFAATACLLVAYTEKMEYFAGMVAAVIPFTAGVMLKKDAYKYVGLCGFLLSQAGVLLYDPYVVIMLILTVPYLCGLYAARFHGDGVLKGIFHAASMAALFFVSCSLSYRLFRMPYPEFLCLALIITGAAHILVIKAKILQDDGRVFEIMTSAVTGILMFLSLRLLDAGYPVAVTLVAIALFMMNVAGQLKRGSDLWRYYIAFKLTVLLFAIFNAYWNINIIYSIVMLLFALGCIVFGFAFSYRAFRMYGLGISMVCIFKLVMMDLDNSSGTLGSRALGFLVCGLICFGINYVYNRVSRMVEAGNDENGADDNKKITF